MRERARAILSAEDRGQSLVEFALTLPVLLLVLTGMATIAVAMSNYLMLTEATSVGARALAVGRAQTIDPCATVAQAVYGALPHFTQAQFTFALNLNGVSYAGTSCSSTSPTTGAAGNLKQGQPATVTVTYPCNLVAYKFVSTCSMLAQTTEVVQ
jgi:Flp pilus assembly protein TadG